MKDTGLKYLSTESSEIRMVTNNIY